MEIENILVSMPTRPWHREKMRQALGEVAITFSDSTNMADDELAPFDAVVGYVNPDEGDRGFSHATFTAGVGVGVVTFKVAYIAELDKDVLNVDQDVVGTISLSSTF